MSRSRQQVVNVDPPASGHGRRQAADERIARKNRSTSRVFSVDMRELVYGGFHETAAEGSAREVCEVLPGVGAAAAIRPSCFISSQNATGIAARQLATFSTTSRRL